MAQLTVKTNSDVSQATAGMQKLAGNLNKLEKRLEKMRDVSTRTAQQIEHLRKKGASTAEINELLGRNIKKATDQARRMGKELPKPIAQMEKFGRAGSKLAGTGSKLAGTFQALGLTLGGLAIGSKLRDMARESMAFEQSFANVSTVLDAAPADLAAMRKGILALGGSLGSARELTDALYEALSAGVDQAKAVEFVGDAAKFAKAGLTSAKSAVDVLTTALNAYGMSADQAGRVSDVLFTTVRLGKTTADQLASSLGKVIGVAATAGVSFEDLNATIAALTTSGIKTSEATTALKAIISNIAKPTAKASETAEQLGIDFSLAGLKSKGFAGFLQDLVTETQDNTQAQSDLFGSIEAFNAIAVLASNQGAKRLTEALEKMESATGATDEAFQKQTGTLGQQVLAFWNNLQNRVMGAESALSKFLTPTLQEVNKVLEESKIPFFGGSSAAIAAAGAEKAKQQAAVMAEAISGFARIHGTASREVIDASLQMAEENQKATQEYTKNLEAAAKAAEDAANKNERLKRVLESLPEAMTKGMLAARDIPSTLLRMPPPRLGGKPLDLPRSFESMLPGRRTAPLGAPDFSGVRDRANELLEKSFPHLSPGEEFQEWAANLERMREKNREFAAQISTIMTDFSGDLADRMLDGFKGFRELGLGILRDFSKLGLRIMIEQMVNPLGRAMGQINFGGAVKSGGGLFGKIFGAALGFIPGVGGLFSGLFSGAPKTLKLAEGGIITQPSFGFTSSGQPFEIAENGPEAVVPMGQAFGLGGQIERLSRVLDRVEGINADALAVKSMKSSKARKAVGSGVFSEPTAEF